MNHDLKRINPLLSNLQLATLHLNHWNLSLVSPKPSLHSSKHWPRLRNGLNITIQVFLTALASLYLCTLSGSVTGQTLTTQTTITLTNDQRQFHPDPDIHQDRFFGSFALLRCFWKVYYS